MPHTAIRTDASTSGMGAILFVRRRAVAYFAVQFNKEDFAIFGTKAGEPRFMAEYELLTMFVAACVWQHHLNTNRAAWLIQADSKAALGAALKLASPQPLVNALAAELSLQLECVRADIVLTEHWRNAINVEADALSRLAEGKVLPDCVRGLAPTPVRPRRSYFRAWPY